MRLRLYHHPDGARVAYREQGTGPALALLHSALLSHMEWEPVVDMLSDRFRVVLPDLPLHGDSEMRPEHPYTLDWLADVLAGFCAEVLGSRALLGGHDLGAEIIQHAVLSGRVAPTRVVLMPNRMHAAGEHALLRRSLLLAARAGAVPGIDLALSYGTRVVFTPQRAMRLSARHNPAAADLLRHAFADVPGNAPLLRSWSRFARSWSCGASSELLGRYRELEVPVLLLWADRDPLHRLAAAEEALAALPNGQLRVLESVGFLMAYDDPVGLARELVAFCG